MKNLAICSSFYFINEIELYIINIELYDQFITIHKLPSETNSHEYLLGKSTE